MCWAWNTHKKRIRCKIQRRFFFVFCDFVFVLFFVPKKMSNERKKKRDKPGKTYWTMTKLQRMLKKQISKIQASNREIIQVETVQCKYFIARAGIIFITGEHCLRQNNARKTWNMGESCAEIYEDRAASYLQTHLHTVSYKICRRESDKFNVDKVRDRWIFHWRTPCMYHWD